MRKWLRTFLAWLDTRFPERVVVTQAEFLAMKAKLDEVSKVITEKRLENIESEIRKFNATMGFAGVAKAPNVVPFAR